MRKFVCRVVYANDNWFNVHQDACHTDPVEGRRDLEAFAAEFAEAHPDDNVSIHFEEEA